MCLRIQIDKYKPLPGLHRHWNQTIVLAFEVLHAIELRHSLERSIEPVVPSMIGTMQNRRLAAFLGHHRRRMMAADIVKRPQHSIVPADGHQRLSRDGCRHKLSRALYLVHSSHHLPGLREDRLPFQVRSEEHTSEL